MINKDDFCLFDIERIIKEETPLEFEVTFKVNAIVEDTLILKPNKLKYTIFRGFESEKHSLKLKKLKGRSTLKNIQVYKPYLEKDE